MIEINTSWQVCGRKNTMGSNIFCKIIFELNNILILKWSNTIYLIVRYEICSTKLKMRISGIGGIGRGDRGELVRLPKILDTTRSNKFTLKIFCIFRSPPRFFDNPSAL